MSIRELAKNWLQEHHSEAESNKLRASKYYSDKDIWFLTFDTSYFDASKSGYLSIMLQYEHAPSGRIVGTTQFLTSWAVQVLIVPRYSEERKAVVLAKLSPPHSMTVAALAREEGISDQTLYNWRTQAREEGRPVPGSKAKSDQWSAEAKLATVIETAPLSEEEFSQYCREKGLYPEQVRRWKEESLQGFQRSAEREKQLRKKSLADQKQIKKLERELRHKEKALAETAALLVLRKKLDALWENDNGDD